MLKNKKIKSCSFLKIKQLWSHLLKKCLMENFIFCACQRTTGFYGTVSNKGLKQIFLWCSSNGWNVKNYETNKGRQQQSKNILKLKIGKKQNAEPDQDFSSFHKTQRYIMLPIPHRKQILSDCFCSLLQKNRSFSMPSNLIIKH